MKIAENVCELIGNTPLIALKKITAGADAFILGKLEKQNPGGSIKDRLAMAIIDEAERTGALKSGECIVEATSGNTGVGLAMIAAARGYRCKLYMPDTFSVERRNLFTAMGAELVLTPGAEGMGGAVRMAEEYAREKAGVFLARQFENAAAVNMHERTTAEEIWRDTDGAVDVFIAGAGTASTISGVSRGLKKHNPEIYCVAVEPAESSVLSGGKAGSHGIQGIGAGFVPKNYLAEWVDEVLPIASDAAKVMTRRLAREEGLLCGISSGAAVVAALEIAGRARGKRIVAILPDTGERYLSTDVFMTAAT